MLMRHTSDGTDEAGRGLEVTIRLGPDGRLYVADIPPDLIPVLLALAPDSESVRVRAELAATYRTEDHP